MTELREIQTALHDFLQGKPSAIESYVVGKNSTEVKRRLAVYQEAYQLRLEANLRAQYPILSDWLLHEDFSDYAKGYDQAFPPTDYAIRHYAAHFSDYLIAHNQDFLAAVARFEWAMNTALDNSSEAVLLQLTDLQKLTTDQLLALHFQFHPSLQFLSLHYDVGTFWQAITQKKTPIEPDYCEKPYYFYLWRKAYQPYFCQVEALEHQLIEAAQSHNNFADLCAIAQQDLQEQAIPYVAETLLRWINNGWLRA